MHDHTDMTGGRTKRRGRTALSRAWRITAILLLFSLEGGCAYDPPVTGDRASPKFQSDLAECRTAADKAAHHAVISRFLLWITYPVSLPIKERRELRNCMTGKGYPLAG
jgi:hypothetical protein